MSVSKRILLLVCNFVLFCSEAVQTDRSQLKNNIVQGIKSKRVGAYICEQIYNITDRYDVWLHEILRYDSYCKNSEGEITNTEHSGESVDIIQKRMLDFLPQSNSRQLAMGIDKLTQSLLLDLWGNLSLNDVVQKCVYALFSMQEKSVEIRENYCGYPWDEQKLFKIITQSFSHSRSLMGMSGCETIIKLIMPETFQEYKLKNIGRVNAEGLTNSTKLLGELSSSGIKTQFWPTNCYQFMYSDGVGKDCEIVLKSKSGGGQFGGIFEVIEPKAQSKRYYCKAYWGYPAKGNFNSEKAFASSISFVRSSDIRDEGCVENNYNKLDFKELFVYKVLESLEIGPKVHFFKVPSVVDGFFILTEDLNVADKHFIEMGKIDKYFSSIDYSLDLKIKNALNDIQMARSNYEKFDALIGLLEIDTINRFLHLHDSNEGNFGWLAQKSDNLLLEDDEEDELDIENIAKEWLKQTHEFRIVDFIAPLNNESYEIDEIFQTFLDGNDVTRYLLNGLMDLAIHRSTPRRKKRVSQKNNEEKVFFGKKVIASLEARFAKHQSLAAILNSAKKSVEDFLNDKYEEISAEYFNDSMNDLDRYIDGIKKNYNALKDGIENYKNEIPVDSK